ncbi:unnamed protein product (mitochondrion) [Plasmodiophora brassicae]|uniref:Enhancer of polycomb-like protein n=1 Tax=Plasmodiophora brassicae TaxID=37360 RepID=A0A0G4J0N7_PLABS|nr:hypothetical protein PBRA_008183 [Plasmodiophora brassicae]SPR01178.1 unnamed protein product [Plasmodiophora brassicae]
MSRHLRTRNVDAQRRLRVAVVDTTAQEDEAEELQRLAENIDVPQHGLITTGAGAGPEIPVPDVLTVSELPAAVPGVADGEAPKFRRPHHYIHYYQHCGSGIISDEVHYDLRKEDMEWCTEHAMDADVVESLMTVFEKEAGQRTMSYDCQSVFGVGEAVRLASAKYPENIAAAVYEYWIGQRRRKRRTLISVFNEPPTHDDPSPHVAFRSRENTRKIATRNPRKNDANAFCKLRLLRSDTQNVLHILELIQKREALKRNRLLLEAEEFDVRLSQMQYVQIVKASPSKTAREKEVMANLESSVGRSTYQLDILANRAKSKRKIPRIKVRPATSGVATPRPAPQVVASPSQPVAPVTTSVAPLRAPLQALPSAFDFKFANIALSSDEESSEGETESDVAFYAQVERYLAGQSAPDAVSRKKKSRRGHDPYPDFIGQVFTRVGRCGQVWLDPVIFDKFGVKAPEVVDHQKQAAVPIQPIATKCPRPPSP